MPSDGDVKNILELLETMVRNKLLEKDLDSSKKELLDELSKKNEHIIESLVDFYLLMFKHKWIVQQYAFTPNEVIKTVKTCSDALAHDVAARLISKIIADGSFDDMFRK